MLVPTLTEQGYDADVVDLLWFGNELPAGTPLRQKDLFDCVAADLEGYEQVIFLAGLSNDPMAEFSPARNFIDNGALPSYLAYVAKRAGVKRFIYASSCSVYGYTVDSLYDEDSPVVCGYPYGISKLQGERGVLQLGDDAFSTIAIRQGTVCGYSPRMRFDLIVNAMYMTAMRDGMVTVNNPGIWRPIVDIRDTCAAFVRAIQAGPAIGGVYNVASGNFTVGQVGELVQSRVEALTGQKIKLTIKSIADARNYKVSCERAKTQLGFVPKFSIADMIDSLHEHRAEFGDYSVTKYSNIAVFKELEIGQGRR